MKHGQCMRITYQFPQIVSIHYEELFQTVYTIQNTMAKIPIKHGLSVKTGKAWITECRR